MKKNTKKKNTKKTKPKKQKAGGDYRGDKAAVIWFDYFNNSNSY